MNERDGLLTPGEVERRIIAASDWLDEVMDMETGILASRADEAKRAEAHYKVEFARHRIARRIKPGNGPKDRTTNDEADDHATVETESQLTDYLVKEAKYANTRDATFAKRSQIDALRTISANQRAVT